MISEKQIPIQSILVWASLGLDDEVIFMPRGVTPQSEGCLRCVRAGEWGSANTVSAGSLFDHFLILDLWRAFFKSQEMVGSCKPAIQRPLLPSQMPKSRPVFVPWSCSGNGWRTPSAGYSCLRMTSWSKVWGRQNSVPTALQRATIREILPPPAKGFEKYGHHVPLPAAILSEQIKVHRFLLKEAWEVHVFLLCGNLQATPLATLKSS